MADEKKIEQVLVVAGDAAEKGKVALWERHPAHPHAEYETEGEVWVKDTPVMVGRTKGVNERLRAGVLVEVKDGETIKKYKAAQLAAASGPPSGEEK